MNCQDMSVPISTDNDYSEEDFELGEKGEKIFFSTKIERLLFKLKILKNKAKKYADQESLKHLNW
jgi:hypothetical protein